MPNVTEGPFVQVACFCENVIEDRMGVLSLIRIIDTLEHAEATPSPPVDMPEFNYKLYLVLMLKAGAATGRNEIRVVPERPDGASENAITLTAHFDGGERGQNVVVQIDYRFKLEGLYWFNVYVGDSKLTSMPLRVKYNRIVRGANAPHAG